MVDQSKIDLIRRHFGPLMGKSIVRFQTAESRLLDEDSWFEDTGLPIRIHFESDALIGISWSRFDDLWLANDHSLPCAADPTQTRWIENGAPWMSSCIGKNLRRVLLGKGQMSIEGQGLDIWTRLVLDLGQRFLEVSNGLDDNCFEVHSACPDDGLVDCLR